MKSKLDIRIVLAASVPLIAISLGARGAYAQSPPIAERGVASLVEVQATVVGVNLEDRLVTLKGPERTVTVHVDKKYPYLDQVMPGDLVDARYYEALAIEIVEPGTEPSGTKVKSGKVTIPGEEPTTVATRQVTLTSTVYIVNRADNSVTFQGPDGYYRWVKVKDPRLQPYLEKLKYRDQVVITYTEGLAVSLKLVRR
jgi:hypothetical protein